MTPLYPETVICARAAAANVSAMAVRRRTSADGAGEPIRKRTEFNGTYLHPDYHRLRREAGILSRPDPAAQSAATRPAFWPKIERMRRTSLLHIRYPMAALAIMAMAWHSGRAQEAGRTVWDGVYSAAQAELGQHQYSGQCGSCHGPALEGGHMFGSRTRTAPALRGEEFLSHWNGRPVAALFDQISTYMPLDHPGSLGEEVSTNIMTFILRENGFPPGSHELPPDIEVMQRIQIAARKK